MPLYPLKFKPRFLPKIWGGRKMQSILGKEIPADAAIGESWELYDFPPGSIDDSTDWTSSQVANGPLAGQTLHQLVHDFGADLLGDVPPSGPHRQFPILIKFLDAQQDLSVQVHPDHDYANTHPGTHLKTEAWYVIQSDPGARIYNGIRAGTTRAMLQAAVENGTVEQHLRSVPVRPAQSHYLPSGTVHALGAGILVAEVQTPSDTTFRLFDFNRIEPATGKLRTLHVEQALACIDYSGKQQPPQQRSHVAGLFTTVSRLITSPYFTLEKVRFTEGIEEPVPYDQPVVWIVLEGQAQVTVKGLKEPTRFAKGDTLLLPAKMDNPIIKTLSDCVWLEVTFPTGSKID